MASIVVLCHRGRRWYPLRLESLSSGSEEGRGVCDLSSFLLRFA